MNPPRLTPAEFEYLHGLVDKRLESWGPNDDLTRYVYELRARLQIGINALYDVQVVATDHSDNDIQIIVHRELKKIHDEVMVPIEHLFPAEVAP